MLSVLVRARKISLHNLELRLYCRKSLFAYQSNKHVNYAQEMIANCFCHII